MPPGAIQCAAITHEVVLPEVFNQASKPRSNLEEIHSLENEDKYHYRKTGKSILWKILQHNCSSLLQKSVIKKKWRNCCRLKETRDIKPSAM